MAKPEISDKVQRLSNLVAKFDDDWGEVMALAAGLSGLKEPPPFGDKFVAIFWGAVDALGQMLDADMTETIEAILIHLADYPDRDRALKNILDVSRNPRYREWVSMAGQAAVLHASGRKEAKYAYGPLAVKYIESGGGS